VDPNTQGWCRPNNSRIKAPLDDAPNFPSGLYSASHSQKDIGLTSGGFSGGKGPKYGPISRSA